MAFVYAWGNINLDNCQTRLICGAAEGSGAVDKLKRQTYTTATACCTCTDRMTSYTCTALGSHDDGHTAALTAASVIY